MQQHIQNSYLTPSVLTHAALAKGFVLQTSPALGSSSVARLGVPVWWPVMEIMVGKHTVSFMCGVSFSLGEDRRRREKGDSLTHTNTWSIDSRANTRVLLTREGFVLTFGSPFQSGSLPHQLATAHPLHTLCCGK